MTSALCWCPNFECMSPKRDKRKISKNMITRWCFVVFCTSLLTPTPLKKKKNESWWNWWNCLPSWRHRYISGRTLPSLVTPFNNFSMFIISFKQLLQTLNILFQTKVNWHISQSLIFNSYQSRPCVEISKVFDRYLPQYALAEILPNCTKMKNIIFSNHTVSLQHAVYWSFNHSINYSKHQDNYMSIHIDVR